MSNINNWTATTPAVKVVSEYDMMDFWVRQFGNPDPSGNTYSFETIGNRIVGMYNFGGTNGNGTSQNNLAVTGATESPVFTKDTVGTMMLLIDSDNAADTPVLQGSNDNLIFVPMAYYSNALGTIQASTVALSLAAASAPLAYMAPLNSPFFYYKVTGLNAASTYNFRWKTCR